jgi:hypothetical protein
MSIPARMPKTHRGQEHSCCDATEFRHITHAAVAVSPNDAGKLRALPDVGMNVFVAMQWEEYSSASHTVSELSAIGSASTSALSCSGSWCWP